MKYRIKYDLSHVTSVQALQREQLAVQQRLHNREHDLRMKMYEIPAELAAAGANSLIPRMFRGKITDAALNGGKKLINKFFVPEEQQSNKLLTHAVKNKGGILSVLSTGLKLLKGKK